MILPPLWFWFRLRHEHLERIPAVGPAIVACNHISYLDPLTNGEAVHRRGQRPRFLAKEELFRIPVVGRVLRGAKQIPVVRGTRGVLARRGGGFARARRGRARLPGGHRDDAGGRAADGRKTGVVRLALRTGCRSSRWRAGAPARVAEDRARVVEVRARPVWTSVGEPIDVTWSDEEAPPIRELTEQ